MLIKWDKSGTYKWIFQRRINPTNEPFWGQLKAGDEIELKLSVKFGKNDCSVSINGGPEIIEKKVLVKQELLKIDFKKVRHEVVPLTLKTRIKILNVKKKTNASFWKTVNIGDMYELQYKMEEKRSFEKKYQPVISVFKDGVKVYEDTEESFLKNSSNFEIEEI